MTGRLACAWELVEATSTQVMAPAAQLNGTLAMGVGAGGRVETVVVDTVPSVVTVSVVVTVSEVVVDWVDVVADGRWRWP